MIDHRLAIRLLFALLLGAATTGARAQEFSILYHERVTAPLVTASSNDGSLAPLTTWSFVAFGRQFDAELERNDRMIAGLDATQRAQVRDIELFAGRLTGIAGSWVRLTRHESSLSGVIWDGIELYAVDAAPRVARYFVTPDPGDADGVVIYRWRDTVGMAGGDTVIAAPDGRRAAAAAAGERTIQTLPPLTAGNGQQLDIGIVSDVELVQREGSAANAQAAMLSAINVVDGIFLKQVGIHINVAQIETFATETDPFTATDSSALLSELENHKLNTPALRDQGLIHLFTGRTLSAPNGQPAPIGIGTLGSLCEAKFGAGLTQASAGTYSTALVAAHEIGHNFGAPHDAENGSDCSGTGDAYIMAPRYNGATQFSQCSIDHMTAEIAAATCLHALQASDVAMRVVRAPEVNVREGTTLGMSVAVDNLGTVDALGLTLLFEGTGVTMFGNHLDSSYGGADMVCGADYCRFARVAAGQSVTFTLNATANSGGAAAIDVGVTTLNDVNVANNSVHFDVNVVPWVNLAATLTPARSLLHPGEPVTFVGTVKNLTTVTAHFVEVRVAEPPLLATTSGPTASVGSCAPELLAPYTTMCVLGDLAPGASATITWSARGRNPSEAGFDHVGIASLYVRANDFEPQTADNNPSSEVILGTTIANLETSIGSVSPNYAAGAPIQLTVRVTNRGPDAAHDVAASYSFSNSLGTIVKAVTSPTATCDTTSSFAEAFTCRIATLAVGETMTVTLTGSTTEIRFYQIGVAANTSSSEPDFQNNSATAEFSVSAAPATPPPVASGAGGGGGGGGALDFGTLLGLGILLCRRKLQHA